MKLSQKLIQIIDVLNDFIFFPKKARFSIKLPISVNVTSDYSYITQRGGAELEIIWNLRTKFYIFRDICFGVRYARTYVHTHIHPDIIVNLNKPNISTKISRGRYVVILKTVKMDKRIFRKNMAKFAYSNDTTVTI